MNQRHEARKLVCLSAFLILLQGCSQGGDSAARTAIGNASGDQSYNIEMTGSVGDGPVVDAFLTVFANDAEILSNTISDQNAGYNIQLQTQSRHYPLTIEASGGLDLVTGLPLDFLLLGAATEPDENAVAAVANVNPFTSGSYRQPGILS